MKAALDTNVLAYAEGINDSERRDVILALLSEIPQETIIVPAQILGELFNVLVKKAGKTRKEARRALLSWRDAFAVAETSSVAMQAAADLATDHRLDIWDAVVVAVASQSGCRLLLSEDLQDGFTWGGVTVVDPFASPRHVLLSVLLGQAAS